MRKLIVTRGLPGSGKSHTLAELGLADFTVGADALRLLIGSPILTSDGRMMISPEHDQKVWAQLHEIIGHRMARGEVVVADATHPTAGDFKTYLRLAKDHRYDVACLDFSEVPPDVSNWHNDGRTEHRIVPPHAVQRISAAMQAGQVPEGVERIMVRSNRSHLAATRDWLQVPVLDLSGFQRVMHVGDIQGCATALRTLMGDGGLRDDTFHIFVGDLCDRGEENGEVVRWMLDHVVGRSNARILFGNHEEHLQLEANGRPPVSEEFAGRTLPQLRAAGITRRDLGTLCDGLDDMLLYRFGGQQVMVTHAGLATVPTNPWMISRRQCAHGTGRYEEDVDAQFDQLAPAGWVQVHGHRNHRQLPSQAAPRSFNLESAVEAGGQMRGLVLDGRGFQPVEVANPVFRPFRDRTHRRMTIVPPWMKGEPGEGVVMAPELRAAMQAHNGVRENPSQMFPNIVSYSFTKKVFYDASWDDVTVKARGLFVNRDSGEIVARSYPKFFNLGERGRPEVAMEALRETLQFPLTGWLKENGFLGLIGYDRASDGLLVSSKTMIDGPFSEWAREILAECIPSEGRRDALRRFLRDCEAAIPMEVIDPVRDPHIIDYDRPKVVFLDCVRRSTEFQRLPYDDLVRLGREFGVEVKQRHVTLPNWQAFEGWCARNRADMSRRIEGVVFEDAAGFQVKFKTPFYDFWKLARGMVGQMVVERKGGRAARGLDPQFLESRGLGFTAPLAAEFKAWCETQPTERLQGSILDLRAAFEVEPRPEMALELGAGGMRP